MSRKFIIRNDDIRANTIRVIGNLPLEPIMQVTIAPFRKSRSLDQNAKWHAMVRDIAIHTGHTPDEMKQLVKFSLGYHHEVEGITVFDETSKFKAVDMITLIEQTYQWGVERGVEFHEISLDFS